MSPKDRDRPQGADELSDLQEHLVEQFIASLKAQGVPVSREQVEEFKREMARAWRRRASSSIVSERPAPPGRKRVLVIENDRDVAREYAEHIEDEKLEVSVAYGADAALKLARRAGHFDAVVVDIRMPPGKALRGARDPRGKRTGLELTKLLVDYLPEAIFIALTTFDDDAHVPGFFARRAGYGFALKRDNPPKVFARFLRRRLLAEKPRVFIVHGHDHQTLDDLKDYLQQTLKFDEPVVLHEQTSGALTVIEKYEQYAQEADVVFALFTPDDFDSNSNKPRARQNVVFEYGYFLSHFGRRSGKVIILRKGEVELPSDLSGLLPIDISEGIRAADKDIRRELREFLDDAY
jgi:CheY-like chemotaxis protein